MSAQPTIDVAPADRPRWTPTVVPPVAADAPATAAERRGRFVPALSTPPTPAEVAALRPASRASAWRRRLGAVAVLVLLAFLLTAAIGRVTAGAQLADPVAGTVTVGPGETLWDVAAATAPAGVDVREQLEAISDLNGFDGGNLDPWTVVLLPAR
jgi:Tfp pilus assembly protein FimV